jgi:hypothetical protein
MDVGESDAEGSRPQLQAAEIAVRRGLLGNNAVALVAADYQVLLQRAPA